MKATTWSILVLFCSTSGHSEDSPAVRRTTLLQIDGQDVKAIAAYLDDANGPVRRTAIRRLTAMGAKATESLEKALEHSDYIIRRAALFALCESAPQRATDFLDRALKDKEVLVRMAAVEILARLEPRSDGAHKLLVAAQDDEAASVSQIAGDALWPFFKKVVLLSQRDDYDHDVKVVQKIPLPTDGWKFKTDDKRQGHLKNWFETSFDDSKWSDIGIAKAWEKYGHTYDGVAWYRLRFKLPAKPDHLATEIHFEAVDESTWAWVNGTYIGQHDVGPHGWSKPFRLDATREVKWGEENLLVVRVLDTKFAGGIWKPVTIELVK